MIGINVNNLDTLIKKNNFYLSSVKDSRKKLTTSISSLEDCYDGNSLNYLFSAPIREIENIKAITEVIQSYSDTLTGVKFSYRKQDSIISNQINRINSSL